VVINIAWFVGCLNIPTFHISAVLSRPPSQAPCHFSTVRFLAKNPETMNECGRDEHSLDAIQQVCNRFYKIVNAENTKDFES
jgi:hypothetical protein